MKKADAGMTEKREFSRDVVVSVIVPSFNQAQFLEATLLSVAEQDYPHVQLIVMDGGSTDGSIDIIRRFEKHIHYWHSAPDGGQTSAIRKGIEISTGELVTYLNSDDVLLPGAVSNIVRKYDGSKDVLLFGNHLVIDGEGRVREKIKCPPHVRWIAWRTNPVFSQPGTFFTRELYDSVGGVDTTLQYSMDLDLFLKFMTAGARFVRVGKFLAGFRRHSYQKGLSRKWLQICDANRKEIERRYASYRGGKTVRRVARFGHFVLQLSTFDYFYTFGFRLLVQKRIRRFRPEYSD